MGSDRYGTEGWRVGKDVNSITSNFFLVYYSLLEVFVQKTSQEKKNGQVMN